MMATLQVVSGGGSVGHAKGLKPISSSRTHPKMVSVPTQNAAGPYVLGATIGEGTFGKVKLGCHTLTKERVAVKILEKKKILNDADWQRVSRETRILKSMRHPHVVQLYEV
eukprot:GHVT01035402.1.p1 GENE.GHVT01035402.1~~GHVT01035402.1.p1  ORF type:complete len:111 (+),score=5.39 GHVT01035402.1:1254-1586(+)